MDNLSNYVDNNMNLKSLGLILEFLEFNTHSFDDSSDVEMSNINNIRCLFEKLILKKLPSTVFVYAIMILLKTQIQLNINNRDILITTSLIIATKILLDKRPKNLLVFYSLVSEIPVDVLRNTETDILIYLNYSTHFDIHDYLGFILYLCDTVKCTPKDLRFPGYQTLMEWDIK